VPGKFIDFYDGCIATIFICKIAFSIVKYNIFRRRAERQRSEEQYICPNSLRVTALDAAGAWHTIKTTHMLKRVLICLGSQNKTGVVLILIIFQDTLTFSHRIKRSWRELSINVAELWSILKNEGVVRILVIFQDRPMFSHIIEKVLARVFH